MAANRFEYRVIFDKLDKHGAVTRGTVVSFATLPDNKVRVVVMSRRKRKTYDITVDPKDTGNAALAAAMHRLRDKL
jgi:hypothetical protein